jgi:predicted methyltransferase
MKTLRPILWPLVCIFAFTAFSTAFAQEQIARMRTALASPERPAEDKARDAARRPYDVIPFVGIATGMRVLDVFAGDGWYTEVLSAAVGPTGKVYMQNAPGMIERRGDAYREQLQARADRLGNVELLLRDLSDLGMDGQMDAAMTALNLHDAYGRGGEAAGLAFLKGIYDALKPGGVAGIIDHVGVPGKDNGELHRIEKATAQDLLTKTGFVIEAESDLLANPKDDHTLTSHDPALGRNTDRMLFRVRKPL